MLLGAYFMLCFSAFVQSTDIFTVILSQDDHSNLLSDSWLQQFSGHRYTLTNRNFAHIKGHWAVFPILNSVLDVIGEAKWIFVIDSTMGFNQRVNLTKLNHALQEYDSEKMLFIGHSLYDDWPVMRHHYFGAGQVEKLAYPFLGTGMALSVALCENFIKAYSASDSLFVIDVAFELALLIQNKLDAKLINRSDLFCVDHRSSCAVEFDAINFQNVCKNDISIDDVYFAVKTCEKFHHTRVPIIKETWTTLVPAVTFYSETADSTIPTIAFGGKNVERGFCEKTFTILRQFLSSSEQNWLVITDDDTLFSPFRLVRLLKCFDAKRPIIIGERFGFGFSPDGRSGYDYPTGGAGMVFSREGVRRLLSNCDCSAKDTPDDMQIGICALMLDIPIFHYPAFHQYQAKDYPKPYLYALPSISFHKWHDEEPSAVYEKYLVDNADSESNMHIDL